MAAIPEDKLNEIKEKLADDGYLNAVFGRAQKVGELRILPVVEVAVSLPAEEGEPTEAKVRPIGMVVVDGAEAEFKPVTPSDETAREALGQVQEMLSRGGRRQQRRDEWQGGDQDRRRDRGDDRDCGCRDDRDSHRHPNDRPPGAGWGPVGELFGLAFRALHRR